MDHDLIIIGAGPAGYVAAIRAGQVGLKTAVVEKASIGGMCLNWGCIPTKAMLESAKKLQAVKEAAAFGVEGVDEKKLSFNWKKVISRSERIVKRLTKGIEYLLKKNGVEIIQGEALINSEISISVENRLLEAENIIIATGSRPQKLKLPMPDELIIEIEDLLKLEELPRKPIIIGQGANAAELAQFFKLAGKAVTWLSPGIPLLPGLDPQLEAYLKTTFKKDRIEILAYSEIKGYEKGELLVDDQRISADKIINASLRRAVIPESKLDFALDRGFLDVDENLQTSIPGIYAVGDVNGKSHLAHAASAQGLFAINHIKGIKKEFDFSRIPVNIYTYPEIAQIGLIEPQAKDQGIDYKISEFPMSANGKALTEGHSEGFLRLISEKKYGEVLGVQIVADHATDMIGEAAALMQLEGTVYDVAAAIHAHPTVSEVFMEAGYDAFGEPIHK